MADLTIPTEQGALACVEVGSGPLVLCLHGISAHARVFDEVAELLAPSFRVVSLDQRGHGRTGSLRGGYGKLPFARDAAAVVEHLDAGPAIVLGHSLGARNAIVVASRFPEHVRAVLAVEYVPDVEHEVLDRLRTRVIGGTAPFGSWDELRSYLIGRYPLLPREAIDRRMHYGYVMDAAGEIRALAQADDLEATADGLYEDTRYEYEQMQRPSTVIRGAESKFVSAEAFAMAQQRRPDLSYEVVPESDHYVPEIRPTDIADHVREATAL